MPTLNSSGLLVEGKRLQLLPTHFSFECNSKFSERVILNKGEVLNIMTGKLLVKPSKYDIKDIFIKNKIEYKLYRVNGEMKKGFELYEKYESNNNSTEQHFL